jgi:membrane protease YdiL (CAAX protease family)
MGALAWLVAPALADRFPGDGHVPMAKALIVSLIIGLVWQCVLVATLLHREQGTLRWSTAREALWLRSPRSPSSGRVGGKVWLVLVPVILAFGVIHELIPKVASPANRDFATLVESDAGKAFLHGAWGWYGLILVMFLFNTMLGEEILFRGFLLPRMHGAFGDRDWVANGLLFTAYHLHVPWAMPATLVDTFTQSYTSKRYRSAWMGIAVHSAQSVVLAVLVLTLVL